MFKKQVFFLFLLASLLNAQNKDSLNIPINFLTPELLIGKTMPPNDGYPSTKPQKSLLLSFGKNHILNESEWAYRLNYPTIGITLAAIDFGNSKKVGQAFSVLPYIEFDFLRKKHNDLKMNIGMGASYFNKQFDSITNYTNRGISTKITWSFKLFLYYQLIETNTINWRLGLGYFHHSNGHTRLPNQGVNSFLASASAQINYNKKAKSSINKKNKFHKKNQFYASYRVGIGQNILSSFFNNRKEVYSMAFSLGKVKNKTYKYGLGVYYRFYEHYYDYIKNKELLIIEQYPKFQDHPIKYASAFGVFASCEILMGHFGVECNIGANLFKPSYEIDWKLNQGESWVKYHDDGTPETILVLGELDWYYKVKHLISARMGLKLYAINTKKAPKHNVYIAAHINSNLGQADFSELSLAYVYRFNSKN